MERRAENIKINDAITLINDANESTYYVVCGSKKALMIDTGNGYEDVMKIAREITDLPIQVVNTHGHCDHVFGNMYCKEAWMNPKDFPICEEHFQMPSLQAMKKGAKSCPLHPLVEGDVFDLGDLQLEVIQLAGHTPGSIGLLDRKHRILFSGDAMNNWIWMHLEESLSLAQFKINIEEQMKRFGDAFDYHLSGHTKELVPKQAIYELLNGVDEILQGDIEQDEDGMWFNLRIKIHKYGPMKQYQIQYRADNIK